MPFRFACLRAASPCTGTRRGLELEEVPVRTRARNEVAAAAARSRNGACPFRSAAVRIREQCSGPYEFVRHITSQERLSLGRETQFLRIPRVRSTVSRGACTPRLTLVVKT